jgi:DnaK suppressor protein
MLGAQLQQKESEVLDHIQLMAQRGLVMRHLDRNARVLRHIRRALARTGNGTYGMCARCEAEIGPKRINAVPWTAFCIECQADLENDRDNIDEAAQLYDLAA